MQNYIICDLICKNLEQSRKAKYSKMCDFNKNLLKFSNGHIHSIVRLILKTWAWLYRIRQNFRGGKLSWLCTKHTIHWKNFTVHQAHAIMYCTQQMIQGENFRDWLKNRENRESFPPRKFCRIQYFLELEKFENLFTVFALKCFH